MYIMTLKQIDSVTKRNTFSRRLITTLNEVGEFQARYFDSGEITKVEKVSVAKLLKAKVIAHEIIALDDLYGIPDELRKVARKMQEEKRQKLCKMFGAHYVMVNCILALAEYKAPESKVNHTSDESLDSLG